MKFYLLSALGLGLMMSNLSYGANQCSNLVQCVELASKLTNKKYIYPSDLKGTVRLSKNFKITKENVGDLISEHLYINGFTRIKSKPDQWTIVSARDVRYTSSGFLMYGKDKIPDNYDYQMVHIKLKNPYLAPELSRNFRPFMSRYGRIIDIRKTGTLIINDTGKNINRLLKLVETTDNPLTKDEKEKYEDLEEQRQKIKVIKAKNCSDIKTELEEIRVLIDKKYAPN